MELPIPEWGTACHSENAVVQFSGKTFRTEDEEELCEAVGLFLLEVILSLRDAGELASLPRAEKCHIGVSTYDGVWGWPVWEDRGKEDLV